MCKIEEVNRATPIQHRKRSAHAPACPASASSIVKIIDIGDCAERSFLISPEPQPS
jgi:hypothetical protein